MLNAKHLSLRSQRTIARPTKVKGDKRDNYAQCLVGFSSSVESPPSLGDFLLQIIMIHKFYNFL
jgi:hypothetical protein